MNANIEQLIKQAGISTQYIEYFGPKLLEQLVISVAKKCADIATNSFENDIGHPGDLIDKHFGVEE